MGTIHHLGFDWKSTLTIPLLPRTHNTPLTKYQQNVMIHGWIIDGSINFPCHFQWKERFCSVLFSEISGWNNTSDWHYKYICYNSNNLLSFEKKDSQKKLKSKITRLNFAFLERICIALLAMQTAEIARAILSVCPSVRPSHSGVLSRLIKIRLCGFSTGSKIILVSGKV